MGKLRLSVHRKNEKRKKYGFYPIRIPRSDISVLTVSIPLENLSFIISLPRSLLTESPLDSIEKLHSRVTSAKILPKGWINATEHTGLEGVMVLCKIVSRSASSGEEIYFSLRVKADFSWSLCLLGEQIDTTLSPFASQLPQFTVSVADIEVIIKELDAGTICVGNNDAKFSTLIEKHDGKFMNVAGSEVIATVDVRFNSTIRHKACEVLISGVQRCPACEKHRKALHSMLTRHNSSKPVTSTAPSSHVNYRYLSSSEKNLRLQNMHTLQRQTKLRLDRISAKITQITEEMGVDVDEATHTDLVDIMEENRGIVSADFPENSFQKLFWEQQQKAASLKNARSMRWHPLMIKWCLYLRHLSSRAYETLRDSGCIVLPSQRTLRDYTYYVQSSTGFSAEVDKQLIDATKPDQAKEWEKCVVLVMDEMHLSEDLVYDKHSGALIGFANIGDTNEQLLQFQQLVERDETTDDQPLAKTMLVFMVRGLFSSLQFPYSQFPCATLSGDLLFDPFWEAVYRLERIGLKVLAATADGASANRRLMKIHKTKCKHGEVVYKVTNPYTAEKRQLYFFSDPPHLIKTVRNAWASSKRNLWCNGKEIKWNQLLSLYHRDAGAEREFPGLAIAPKLKREHVYLTSFSKMRVDLAAQVMSETVSKALQLMGGPDTNETVKFVSMFDKFFDCLNVNSYNTGRLQRKVFKQPYRSATDFRLKWLKEEFLVYLDDWKESVKGRKGFSKVEKKKMLLSPETLLGLRMTVLSFTELVPYLFSIDGVKVFLSEHLCQDPLEKFFGCQRQRGGTHDNPSVKEFINNTQALRVINTFCRGPVRGNCRAHSSKPDLEKENAPIPKRRRISKHE